MFNYVYDNDVKNNPFYCYFVAITNMMPSDRINKKRVVSFLANTFLKNENKSIQQEFSSTGTKFTRDRRIVSEKRKVKKKEGVKE